MIQWARRLFGLGGTPAPVRSAPAHGIKARFDNAQSTDENTRSWWMSDYFSAKAANNFQVRRQLRLRSRYEVSNNPYLHGICVSNADDLIGAGGPTLKVTTDNEAYNRQVERAWKEWADEVGLAEKLRTLKLARTVDGEGFLILKTVEDLECSVKLYPVDVEADQVTTTLPRNMGELWVDGLVLHPVTGRPTAYSVLRHHPGDWYFPDLNPLKTDVIKARHVIHWFPKFRPGQVRGVPVFTPSLDLFNELRSFRKAVLKKVQVAANLTAVLETQAPADVSGIPQGTIDANTAGEPFDPVAVDNGTMLTLPWGTKLNQFTAPLDATTYEMFQERCLGEACRPLGYPLNLALGTSMKFNFSSAKLDHINYREGLKVERRDCETVCVNRLFAAFFDEAVMVPGLLPKGATLAQTPHEWHWPGFPTLDAQADTTADIAMINAGTLTWREFWATRGYDWRQVMKQQGEEQKEIEDLGLNFGEPPLRRDNLDEPNSDEGPGKPGGGKPQKKTGGVDAAYNPDQPRDESGKFGEGGGAETEKGKQVEKERDEEDDRIEKERDKEEDDLDEKHTKENRQVEREREKEDTKTERQREKADSAFEDKLDRMIDKSLEKLEEKQDSTPEAAAVNEAIDKAETKEERAAAWEKADELTSRQTAERDAKEKELRENAEAIIEQQDAKNKATRDKEDAERTAKREAEDEERLTQQTKERDAMWERQAAQDDARDVKRMAEDERRAKASKKAALRAGFNESDHPRDEAGRFGEGGPGGHAGGGVGEGKSDDDDDDELAEQHEGEKQETSNAREQEDKATETEREKEDAQIAETREQEDADLTSERETRDDEIKERRDEEDGEITSERDLSGQHSKEDKAIEKDRAKEDKKTEKARDREEEKAHDEFIKDDHKTSDALIDESNEKGWSDEEHERKEEEREAKCKADYEARLAELSERWAKEDAETEAKREKEDKEGADRQNAEHDAREAKVKELKEARAKEDAALAEARELEDQDIADRREQEDAESTEAREKADAQREAERDKEDAALEKKHAKEREVASE